MESMKCGLLFPAVMVGLAVSAYGMDQVLLKNGTRVSGTIKGQSKDQVFIQIGEGNAVFSKKAIRRIYDDIVSKDPMTRVLGREELPPWWVPLSDLYHSDWVNSLESVPAGAIESGDLANVPYLSFRANGAYEMNVYGNPDDPAALEIGFRSEKLRSGEARKRCRQFMVSYLSGMKQLQALYALDAGGGTKLAEGLEIKILPPGAPDAYGGWWISIINPKKLAAARASSRESWQAACERAKAAIGKWTNGETSWRKYSLKDAFKRYLPVERMKEQ